MENIGRPDLGIMLAIVNLLDVLPQVSQDRQLLEIIARHKDFMADVEKFMSEIFLK